MLCLSAVFDVGGIPGERERGRPTEVFFDLLYSGSRWSRESGVVEVRLGPKSGIVEVESGVEVTKARRACLQNAARRRAGRPAAFASPAARHEPARAATASTRSARS